MTASSLMTKLTETMDFLLGSCMPKVEYQEDEVTDAPKDDNYRKQELKQLVGIFASRAQNYIDCIRVSLENQKMFRSFYKLDSKLTTFSIKTNEVVEDILISSMTAILNYDDVYNRSSLGSAQNSNSDHNSSDTNSKSDRTNDTAAADSNTDHRNMSPNKYDELLNNPMISKMNLYEKNRFVLIEYSANNRTQNLVMLVEEVGNSDPFITVLRILKMYSNNGQ